MELFKLYLKEKATFFCLIKLLFTKVRCLINVSVKQHCLPFFASNLSVEIFLKNRGCQKRMCWNRGLRHLCILFIGVSRKLYAKPACFLIVIWLWKEFWKLYFLSFLDYWISLICLTMTQIRGKDIH